MTAATVPPSGWIPIGASELRANTRRFFTRAFAVSAAGHLAVLAAMVWLHMSGVSPEPRLILTPTILVPPPDIRRLPPPSFNPPASDLVRNKSDTGVIDPTHDEEMKPEPLIPGRGVKPVEPAPRTDVQSFAHQSTESTDWRDPEEGAFVAYDRPPVPYYRPTPDYPGWAREQGIQGRVVLHVLVGRDGRVARVTVWKDVAGLTDAARETVARWLFHPALSGKNAVAVWVEIPIDFRL
jgi:periplasmic protein TonB